MTIVMQKQAGIVHCESSVCFFPDIMQTGGQVQAIKYVGNLNKKNTGSGQQASPTALH